jgi:predicted metal-dependent hydrolase
VPQTEILKFQDFEIELQRRAHQRSLRLRVLPPGILRVSCARRTPKRDIARFVLQNIDFIEKQMARIRVQNEKFPPKKYQPGETFPFLGALKKLALIEEDSRPRARIEKDQLVLRGRPTTMEEREALISKFYRNCGRKYLRSRAEFYAKEMKLSPQKLSFRSQSSRWGSCSSQGNISLNWRLMAAPSPVLDYVVVHEIAHLRHYNHSRAFWDLVAEFSPGYKQNKLWLAENQWALDFLAKQ